MSDGTFRGRWVDEVFRNPSPSAEVRVFLLFLAHYHMGPTGRVSEPRDKLAEGLGCHPRKVSAKFAAAIESGLLRQTTRGQKYQTAVYEAVIPGLSQGASTRHPDGFQGAADYHPEDSAQGAADYHPEGAQDATHPHPDDVSGCQHPAPHIYTGDEVGEHGTDAVVVQLFDEEDLTPSRKRSNESAEDPLFAAFYSTYPRKKSPGDARKAWGQAMKKGADPNHIVAAAERFRDDPRRKASDPKFTPYPASWLRAESYDDEPDQPSPARAASGSNLPPRDAYDPKDFA